MAGVIGSLPGPFDPSTGNVKEYLELCEYFFTANGITDDKKKVASLCTTIGPQNLRIIQKLCLPKKPEATTFTKLSELLQTHFKPEAGSAAKASVAFHSRVRQQGESVRTFLGELQRLAEPCKFGKFLSRALRDRFIVGINNPAIQKQILSVPEEELTLDRALQVAARELREPIPQNTEQKQSTAASGTYGAAGDGGNGRGSGMSAIVCECGDKAQLLTTRDGKNKGRQFYKCGKPKAEACGFFQWADERDIDTSVQCKCGEPSKRFKVLKDNPNKGRWFYGCAKPGRKGCTFFQWADHTPSSSSGSKTVHSGDGGGQARAGQKRTAVADNPGTTKKARQCGLCGEKGHTQKTCPLKPIKGP